MHSFDVLPGQSKISGTRFAWEKFLFRFVSTRTSADRRFSKIYTRGVHVTHGCVGVSCVFAVWPARLRPGIATVRLIDGRASRTACSNLMFVTFTFPARVCLHVHDLRVCWPPRQWKSMPTDGHHQRFTILRTLGNWCDPNGCQNMTSKKIIFFRKF